MRAQLIIKIWLVTVIPIFAFTGMSFSARAADITSNLIGHWPLDGNANDSSGNGNHGTLVGDPTWTPEGAGGALYFDGGGDHVDLGNIEAFEFDANEGFTISLWIKLDSYNHSMSVFGRNNGSFWGATNYTWNLLISSKTNLEFGIGDGSNGNYGRNILGMSPGEWYHIAVVAGAIGEEIEFYVDGELQLNRDRDGNRNITRTVGKLRQTSDSFKIGGESPYYTHGIIDEVRIYKRALRPDDIRQLFNDIGNQAPVVLNQDITDPESQPSVPLRRDVRALVNTPTYIALNTPQFSNDMNKDPLTYSIVPNIAPVPPRVGTYRFEGTNLVYTPELDFIDRDYLTFKANDGTVYSNEATISIDVVLPAFPGAEGFGAITTGGRGGRVIHVTTLEDNGDNRNPTPGSLREALGQTFSENDPITIVFDVGGVIEIYTALEAGNNFTLAGQTAPGGLTIMGNQFRVSGGWTHDNTFYKNFIIRNIRFRGSHFYTGSSSTLRSLSICNATHFILDHLSFTGSGDETPGIYKATDYTTQWLSIEESGIWGQGAVHHDKGDHNFGYLNGYSPFVRMTVHHNLIANHRKRLPLVNYLQYGGVDFRNNVIYNWEIWASQFSGYGKGHKDINVIGNSYVVGPSVETGRDDRLVVSYETDQIGNFYPPALEDDPATPLLNERNLWFRNSATIPEPSMPSIAIWESPPQGFVNTPWAEAPEVTTQSAEEAYEEVLSKVGAWPRDATTWRTEAEVRTGRETGGRGLRGPYERFPEKIGALADPDVYPDAPMGGDYDRDGMPDEWEDNHGLNSRDPADRNNTVPEGISQKYKDYTYLEYYLNELADTVIGEPLGEVYTIQTVVSPENSGAIVAEHGNNDQSLFAEGGYNSPYWFGKIDFGTAEYNEGSIAIMKAKPKPGYVFSHWATTPTGHPVDGLTATMIKFPVNDHVTVKAVFTKPTCNINVPIVDGSGNPCDFGNVAGTGDYAQGDVVTLAAYADQTHRFNKWIGGPVDGLENPTVQFLAAENLDIQAEFVSGNGGDVLIDDFNDQDEDSQLTMPSGDPKRWSLSRTVFQEIPSDPGNFALTRASIGSIASLALGSSSQEGADILPGTTVLKFKLYNLGNEQARLDDFRGPWNHISFYIEAPDGDWSTSDLYYSAPFSFPVIEAGDYALVEIPLVFIRNKDLTKMITPESKLKYFNFGYFLGDNLWGSQIAVDDIAFGRAQDTGITALNVGPVANAGRPQITKDIDDDGFEIVLLNGMKSYDRDAGLITSWQWSWQDPIDGPKTAEGFAPTVELPVKRNLEPYDITLTITDEDGLTDTDTVQIIVLASDEAPPLDGILGDVNRDERVNMIDAILVAKSVVGIGSVNTGLADVDGSGTVTLKDALLIAQYANGVITEFPE